MAFARPVRTMFVRVSPGYFLGLTFFVLMTFLPSLDLCSLLRFHLKIPRMNSRLRGGMVCCIVFEMIRIDLLLCPQSSDSEKQGGQGDQLRTSFSVCHFHHIFSTGRKQLAVRREQWPVVAYGAMLPRNNAPPGISAPL